MKCTKHVTSFCYLLNIHLGLELFSDTVGGIKGRQVTRLVGASCVLRLGAALQGGKHFQAPQSNYLASAACSAKHNGWDPLTVTHRAHAKRSLCFQH